MTRELTNRDEVIEKILQLWHDHEKGRVPFQEDIYLYIDEAGHGTVTTYTNIGGNSWLDDDHITVMRLGESQATMEEALEGYNSIGEVLGVPDAQLIQKVRDYRGWSDDEDVSRGDIIDYIIDLVPGDCTYVHKIWAAWDDWFEGAWADAADYTEDMVREHLDTALREEDD